MSRTSKKFLAILLSSAMMLSFMAGCGDSGSTTEKDATTTPDANGTTETTDAAGTPETTDTGWKPGITPVKAGEVEMDSEQIYNTYISSEPATLDSTKASDTYAGDVLFNVMEPLLRIEEDADGKNFVAGAGAETWEANETGDVWTFHLRENTWSDGQPVTANDYAYALKRIIDPATGSPLSYMLAPIKNADAVMNGSVAVEELGIKALDDKTLEITLENPTAYFESLMCTRVTFPVRQDIVEQHGERYGSEMETLVYCGPFQLQSWTHNSEFIMVKNESYWDKDRVHLQMINMKIMSDENSIMNSFDNGSLDTVGVAKKEWLDRFNEKEDASYVTYVSPNVRFDFYNTKDEVFQNANIRKAFTLGLNREELAEVIYQGSMDATYAWVPRNVNIGELGEYRTLVEAPLLKLKEENPDPKQLLIKGMEELGLGSDPSTLKVTMSFGGTDQWMRTYAEYIQQTYKNTLGVNLELDFNEWPTYSDKVSKGEYQIGYMAWGHDFNDPIDLLNVGSSASGSVNTGWENEEFESLLVQARKEMDAQKRLELYKQAEDILLNQDGIFCPVVNAKVNNFRYNHVKNMASTPFASVGAKYIYISGR